MENAGKGKVWNTASFLKYCIYMHIYTSLFTNKYGSRLTKIYGRSTKEETFKLTSGNVNFLHNILTVYNTVCNSLKPGILL